MKNILDFVNINESIVTEAEGAKRGRPRKNKEPEAEPSKVTIDGKVKPLEDIQKLAKKVEKKPADENGCEGAQWAVDEPTSDADKDLGLQYLPKELISNNIRKLYRKFQHNDPFFIQGKAGWGKTSLIKKVAYHFGYKVITVYLDKAEATDLAGIPIVAQGKRSAVTTYSLPPWAGYIYDHPDEKFLLFFDEMNQAAPDVMNALMPIVLEKRVAGVTLDNILVGAAGNLMEENDALSELSKPLESRFKPLIEWEVHTKAAWRDAFSFLHKKYDSVLGLGVMKHLEDNATLFGNPREVELKLIRPILEDLKASKEGKFIISDVEDWQNDIVKLLGEDVDYANDTMIHAQVDELAEYIANLIDNGGDSEDDEDSERQSFSNDAAGIGTIPEDCEQLLKYAMVNGSLEMTVPVELMHDISYDNMLIRFTREDIVDILTKKTGNKQQAESIVKRWERNKNFTPKYNSRTDRASGKDKDAIDLNDLSIYSPKAKDEFINLFIDIDDTGVDNWNNIISMEERSDMKHFITQTK